MTTGHGSPDGKYWQYELGPDTLVGLVTSLEQGGMVEVVDIASGRSVLARVASADVGQQAVGIAFWKMQ